MFSPGSRQFSTLLDELLDLVRKTEGLSVTRRNPPRSDNPYPTSEDLEEALVPILTSLGYCRQVPIEHPRYPSGGYKYDFWRESDGVAMEVMGYRADDEVYKDILKFHVHAGTSMGVLWVPRYKWVKGKRGDRNYKDTLKAVSFADTYMNVASLVVLAYDWTDSPEENTWLLHHIDDEG